MSIELLVLQHTPWEGPGDYLLRLAARLNVAFDVIRVWEEWIPDYSFYDGLLVLGGGPNVDQEAQYPFLVREKQLIREAIAADKPYLGFCLGHQLLADALGAKVGPNFCVSIGFVQGHLTCDGRGHPAFQRQGKTFPLFKWHSQTVIPPLPGHLLTLMTSAECQVEALTVEGRPHILGIQADNHAAHPEDVAMWLQKDQKWLSSLASQGVEVNPAAILDKARKYHAAMGAGFEEFFCDYISLIR